MGAMMVRIRYLWKHTGSRFWHYRRTLPADVQDRLGKSIAINVHTRSDFEAAKLVIPLIEKTGPSDAEVRSGRKFTEAQLHHFAIRWFADFKSRLTWDQPQQPDEVGLPLADEARLDASLVRWVEQESVPVTPASAD
jgi:hypothetical protein